MKRERVRDLLTQVANGSLDVSHALNDLSFEPAESLDFATIDHHRSLRQGFPEVVYGAGKTPPQIIEISKRIIERGAPLLVTRLSLDSADMLRAVSGHHPADHIAAAMRDSGTPDSISAAQYADIKTYLAGDILTKVDRTSMAVSLEVRVPMLDHEFVEWAASLPSRLKLHNGEGKHILKRALEPYVPKENLYRPKQGFATSLAPHFRGPGGRFVREALLGEAMAGSNLFDMAEIGRLVDAHDSGVSDHSMVLWSLLMFDGFLREVHYGQQRASTIPVAS